jgi:hypothetical protein
VTTGCSGGCGYASICPRVIGRHTRGGAAKQAMGRALSANADPAEKSKSLRFKKRSPILGEWGRAA